MTHSNTNSLFHYTRTFENLVGIIRKGFLPNYCGEVMPDGIVWGIPMVSFCDIPLTRADSHRANYGKFAIGLTKSWGYENDLNPLLYIKSESISGAINNIPVSMKNANKLRQEHIQSLKDNPESSFKDSDGKIKIAVDPNDSEILRTMLGDNIDSFTRQYLFGFIKMYDGKDRNGKDIINYDDREWRYILPDIGDSKWLKSQNECENWRGDKKEDKPKSVFNPLTFKVEDIRYILVEKESESQKLIDQIMKIKTIGGLATSSDSPDRQLLMTKIMSVERLYEDF